MLTIWNMLGYFYILENDYYYYYYYFRISYQQACIIFIFRRRYQHIHTSLEVSLSLFSHHTHLYNIFLRNSMNLLNSKNQLHHHFFDQEAFFLCLTFATQLFILKLYQDQDCKLSQNQKAETQNYFFSQNHRIDCETLLKKGHCSVLYYQMQRITACLLQQQDLWVYSKAMSNKFQKVFLSFHDIRNTQANHFLRFAIFFLGLIILQLHKSPQKNHNRLLTGSQSFPSQLSTFQNKNFCEDLFLRGFSTFLPYQPMSFITGTQVRNLILHLTRLQLCFKFYHNRLQYSRLVREDASCLYFLINQLNSCDQKNSPNSWLKSNQSSFHFQMF
ncbi:hypothetical protein TTHERM_000842688 (macronuclear) [Tetrahymena thermophila SB210]|uniref:Uncharacterized protein n=1 Tax=Tetrahymena thermophila (strain SB210) TaxID=312017 RepID=W7X3Y7_TETTS|nr:hypothetical protein TTHERM_000842688 [Tetrahymena thermophila SB210]EWS71133.1 hypothetical protein TTHERM_000842688 [Tetrahymena thermophila SB210]|eukprot:XP_012656341.1 hypothetical protein TTHERM_000842688 [Tetrahymena thermophila SB210]